MYGRIIANLRNEKGLNQREFANIFKIAKSTVSMYELEKREPDFDFLIGASKFFQVSVDYLLGVSADRGRYDDSMIVSDEKEKELIRIYRELCHEDKCEIHGYVCGFAAHCVKAIHQ